MLDEMSFNNVELGKQIFFYGCQFEDSGSIHCRYCLIFGLQTGASMNLIASFVFPVSFLMYVDYKESGAHDTNWFI